MTRKNNAIELLAPAGGQESLLAAVRCGANGVYLGGKGLNARRSADNFDGESLLGAVAYCHLHGVRVYLTLNTILFDDELGELLDALEQCCALGVDGVIVQDLATAAAVRRCAPALPLHASTQMSVHSPDGAKALEELGFRRVVLAREMTAEEIRRVVESTALEVECFVHGALCMCVSGQCLLSSVIGGRSGNRGMCAQPCRLPFAAGNRSHALSLKDLSLVEQLPLLREIGVHSLKIEGRMKRPEYVAGAVTACRSVLAGELVDHETLEAVFSRSGFTHGYLTGERGGEMFGTRQREDVTAAAPVLKKLQNLYHKERGDVPVDLRLAAKRNQPVILEAWDEDGWTAVVFGEPALEAQTTPTTGDRAAQQLGKTGGTAYTVGNIQSEIDENLLLPASALNALRREALEELTRHRTAPRPVPFVRRELAPAQRKSMGGTPLLRVRLHRAEQLTPAVAQGAHQIALPLLELERLGGENIPPLADKLLAELPRIAFDDLDKLDEKLQIVKKFGVKRALAGGLGSITAARRAGLEVHGDFGLNVANGVALEELEGLGLESCTLSPELELRRIRALGGALPRGVLAYGYLPLMVTRNCPVGSAGGCGDCGRGFPELTDRLGNRFFVDCSWQVTELYNCVPLFLADRLDEWRGVDFLTLYFTRESPEMCGEILQLYQTGGALEGDKTRGLYYRRVL